MPVDTRLKDVAQDLLDNLAAALTTAGIDVPERRYITTGDVAHDFASANCADALIVTWDGSFQGVVAAGTGNLTNRPIECFMPLVGQFTIAFLRCVPTVKASGKPPTEAELQSSGEQLLEDAMTLAAVTVAENVSLLPSDLYQIGIGNLQPIGPLGGVGGVTMTVIVGMV